jgi:formylglycine-generating enzyme
MAMRSVLPLAIVMAGAGCSRAIPGGGVMVVLRTDDTLHPDPDSLTIRIGALDGGTFDGGSRHYVMDDASIASPGEYSFPVSFGIDSNGDPSASVSVVASVSVGASVLETQRYVLEAVPTDEVVELDVVFSAPCAPGASSDVAEPWCPEVCAWSAGTCMCKSSDLPAFPFDAGASSSGPNCVADAGNADDATPRDGEGEGGRGGDAGARAVVDGGCEAGTLQCSDLVAPQQCGLDGLWHDQPACQSGFTYCYAGSCIPAPTSCAGTDYSGCESYEVPGGAFLRGEDPLHEDAGAPATIHGFRLDAWELDVARFRKFVTSITAGQQLPDAGAGKHAYLAAGEGLNGGGDGGTYETGWDPSWSSMFPTDPSTWDANLNCGRVATWGSGADGNDARPINCVTWYEAYAFCIWDGGFLPSEGEWNYAAAAGDQQRLYPWGSNDPSEVDAGDYADYNCAWPSPIYCNMADPTNIAAVGFDLGRAAFGQWNLAGNVAEWTLDEFTPYPIPCTDCAAIAGGTQRVFRGGSWDHDQVQLYTSTRVSADPSERFQDVGFRCARSP